MRLDADHTAVYLSRATVRRVLMEVRRRGEVADADEAIGALVEWAIDAALSPPTEPAHIPTIPVAPTLADLLGLSGDGEDDCG